MSAYIIVPDVHIGKGLSLGKARAGNVFNSRVIDQMDLLDWIMQQAIQHNVSHIILTGDIFEDTKPDPSLIALFISWLKRCANNDITVHIVQGNHDILRTGSTNISSLDIIIDSEIDSVFIYKDITTVFIDNTAFTMCPFRDRKSFNLNSNAEALDRLTLNIAYEAASIPSSYRKILIGHLAIEGSIFVGDELDDVANELFCPPSMFSAYDYVWMGHIHKPQVLQTKTSYRPLVAHIGSMDISNFTEAEEKKHVVLIDNETITTLQLPVRPLKKIAVAVPENTTNSTQYVLDKIAEEGDLTRSIVRLEIQLLAVDVLPVDRAVIEKALYTSGVFNVCNITESKKLAPIKKDANNTLTTTMNIPAALKSWITNNVPADKQTAVQSLATNYYHQYKEEA